MEIGSKREIYLHIYIQGSPYQLYIDISIDMHSQSRSGESRQRKGTRRGIVRLAARGPRAERVLGWDLWVWVEGLLRDGLRPICSDLFREMD